MGEMQWTSVHAHSTVVVEYCKNIRLFTSAVAKHQVAALTTFSRTISNMDSCGYAIASTMGEVHELTEFYSHIGGAVANACKTRARKQLG